MADGESDARAGDGLDHPVWAQLLGLAHVATGWRAVLIGEGGTILAEAGSAPGAAPAPISAGLLAAVRTTIREGTGQIVLDPAADGRPLRWVAMPVLLDEQPSAVVLVGGLPAIEPGAPGPGIDPAAARRGARLIAGLVESIVDLRNGGAPGTPGLRSPDPTSRRAAALYDLSTLVASTLEPGPIVTALLSQARPLFGADRAAVFLRGRDGELRCVDAVGLPAGYVEAMRWLYEQEAGGPANLARQAVYIADVGRGPRGDPLADLAAQEGVRTLVSVPFLDQGHLIGAFALYHDAVQEYASADLAALAAFANHVAVALVNARLFENTTRQARRAHFLAEAGRLLNSSLDLGQVLKSLTRAATDVLGEACAIYLLRNSEDSLALTAYTDQIAGDPAGRIAFLETRPPRLGAPGIGQAVLRGEYLLVDEEHPAAPGLPDPYIVEFGARAYLAVPLQVQARLVGALVLWLFNPGLQFAPEDITLARALGDHAAVALENARLYERELRSQQAKDEFLSSVSHELRTPLTAILGYTQLIRKGLAGESNRFGKQLDVIWSQAQRLNRLVESILDISTIEQGQLNLNLERLDLWTVVETALERLRASARRGLAFDVQTRTGHGWIMGDRHRLEQVFGHLISNAIKYSPPEGTVGIEMTHQGGQAVVRIVDSGPGLNAEQLAQLFERYYQGDIPLNHSGGLGLGLYISRVIIEAHGGAISAGGAPGAGAAFHITLPAAAAPE